MSVVRCVGISLVVLLPPRASFSDSPVRQLEAVRTTEPISIDGVLSETVWQRPGNADFTQRVPDEGAKPSQRTEVWVAYDNEAVYFGVQLYDTAPDSIIARLGRRDAELNSDWFYVGIDSYHDKRTGFYFGVNPSGCIQDGTLSNDVEDDDSWDGVWDAGTMMTEKGWTAEFRVPYSQLRFRRADEYVWGINFLRAIERRKEEDWFVFVPRKEPNGVSRYADLVGIRNIEPARAFEILPYAASSGRFAKREQGNPFRDGSEFFHNVGADLKVGLGSNMTLNATINPDFGQVEVDPAVVNLTQYETFFEEKRPFFIDGSSFFDFGNGGVNSSWGFNWGSPNHFYSRRIGRPPQNAVQHDGFEDIPDRTTIIGAAKLTGKITDSWSIGVLQAVTAREYGEVDSAGVRFSDVVEPLASRTVVRSLREFNQGRQAVGILGTSVARDLNKTYLEDNYNRRSFTLGIDGWTNIDSNQTWVMTGWVAGSHLAGTPDRLLDVQTSALHYFHRPDATHLAVDSTSTSLTGYAGRVAVNKQKGNWKFNAALGVISPEFDSNDLGFLFRTDIINGHLVVGYRWYDPDGTFRTKGFNIATFRNFDFEGNRTGDGYFLFWDVEFLNYWGLSGSVVFNPEVIDTRYTRGGPVMRTTNGYFGSVYGYSDSREAVVFGIDLSAGRTESGGSIVSIGPRIQWKPGSGLTLSFLPNYFHDITRAHWVGQVDDPTATQTYGTRYIFGNLDQKELAAGIRVDWTFTPKLSLQLYLQPLISVGRYSRFKELRQPGTYTFNTYGDGESTIAATDNGYEIDPDGPGQSAVFEIENPDFNFKSLRGNAVLRWEYMPGSTMYFAWTQSRTNEEHPGDFRFGRDFRRLLLSPSDNVLLVKVAYWINP